ncbi:MAG: glycoside hydrolase family 99-like domain-containing protein, partial [Planctomycetaceae bacterium]|nr:glycoside hydrolase family 99-like domain-containing protein [Planctomycetaceae bacterium]
TDHGVNVFVFDWYWYEGGPFLENTLNNGFLKAQNNEKMQFYLMWANVDIHWRYFNVHKYGNDESLLLNAAVDWENFKIIVDRVIKQYFKQPNYFKIDGMPVFSIFDEHSLLESFGGSVEETRKAFDYFRDEVKKAGFPGLHLQWNRGTGYIMPEEEAKQFSERVKTLGFNSVTFYTMGGNNKDYLVYGKNSIELREWMDAILDIPFFPCVSVGWDNSPRYPAMGTNDVVHYNNTPQSFAMLLQKAKQYLDNHPEQPKIIVVNAWNEWVEGSYLFVIL